MDFVVIDEIIIEDVASPFALVDVIRSGPLLQVDDLRVDCKTAVFLRKCPVVVVPVPVGFFEAVCLTNGLDVCASVCRLGDCEWVYWGRWRRNFHGHGCGGLGNYYGSWVRCIGGDGYGGGFEDYYGSGLGCG